MEIIIFFGAILIFAWPFVDLVIISHVIQFFLEIEPELKEINKKIGTEPIKNIREVLTLILPKNVKFDDAEKKKKYVKNFFWLVEYIVSGFILLTGDIVFLFITVNKRTVEEMTILIIVFVMNLLILWVLKLSPIFHYLRLGFITNIIDKVAFEIMSPKGKINRFISNIGIKMVVYVVGILTFALYMRLYKQFMETILGNGFIYVFTALIIYHFGGNWVFAKEITLVSRSVSFVNELVKNHKYMYNICKIISYIVFFTFYVVIKFVQLESGDTMYNIQFVEAVGSLFLLDTYFDKMKSINDNKMELHRENKNEVIAEKNKVEKHEINENSVEKINPIPVKGVADVDIDNTAIKEYFEIVNSEYQNERNKKQSFETRAGLLLTLLGAICIFYFQSIKISDIMLLFNQVLTFTLLIKIISGIMIYVLFVLTFIAIIKTIATKRHDNFDVTNINENLLIENKINAMTRLIFTYSSIIKQHREINESRARWYKIALYSTFGLLISTIIYISL